MYNLKELNRVLKSYNKQLYVKKTNKYMAQIFLKNAYSDKFYGGLEPKLGDVKWTGFSMDVPLMALSNRGCYDVYKPIHEVKRHLKHRNFEEIYKKLKELNII